MKISEKQSLQTCSHPFSLKLVVVGAGAVWTCNGGDKVLAVVVFGNTASRIG